MLKRQLFLIYLFGLFLPISIIGSFLMWNNYNTLYKHHEDILVSDNLRIRSIIYEVTTSLVNICETVSENQELVNLVNKDYTSWSQARDALINYTQLSDIYSRQTEISSIKLYCDNETLHSYGYFYTVNEDNKQWFDETVSSPGYHWSTLSSVNSMGVDYEELQLISPINIKNSKYDVVIVITVSNNYLKTRIDNNDLTVDVTVNDNPIFFSTWGNSNEKIDFMSYYEQDFFRYSGANTYMGERSLLEISTMKPIESEDSIYIFSRDPSALNKIRTLQLIALLILAVSIIVPGYIIIRYTLQLTNRVNTLRTEMHRVTSGDYNIIENFKGNDELVDLFEDLQTMIHSIKDRDQTIFDSKMKEQHLLHHQKETELELLSSKINPHFLYNTLETIRMKAFNSNNYDVAEAVKLMGKYMRYNLESTGELTTLKSEIEYINIYLKIQKLRFADKIDFTIDIDNTLEVEKIEILPLLIQPLVENTLKHGHGETTENGIIIIKCEDGGDYVTIKVEDNGVGINKETLEEIRKRIANTATKDKSSFGLYNIQQRLYLFYGQDCHLDIQSTPGSGTSIGFTIPKNSAGESNA